MSEYQDILVLWLNGNEKGAYYSLKNESDQPVTIEPGQQIYLNPGKRPVASLSRKVDNSEDVSNDVPF